LCGCDIKRVEKGKRDDYHAIITIRVAINGIQSQRRRISEHVIPRHGRQEHRCIVRHTQFSDNRIKNKKKKKVRNVRMSFVIEEAMHVSLFHLKKEEDSR
jgi:hypothetical protein